MTRLCHVAHNELDAGICEELAPLLEPQLVFCARSSSRAAPKVRSPTCALAPIHVGRVPQAHGTRDKE